jgi:aerobic carbon-monoxide dehydrogenase medium subunit
MFGRKFDYSRPKDLSAAIQILSRRYLNAAPWLVPPKPASLTLLDADVLVDLSLLDLSYIREGEDGLIHVGSLTNLQDIVESRLLQTDTKGLLNTATGFVASPGIRNLSTLWGAMQAPSGPPEVLLSLLVQDPWIVIQGGKSERRTLRFTEIYEGGNSASDQAEIVIEAQFSPLPQAGCGWALERVARTPHDEAILAAAALVEVSGRMTNRVNLAVAGSSPRPIRLRAIEGMLSCVPLRVDNLQRAAEAAMELSDPSGDHRGSPDYRRAMVEVLVRRAVQNAWERALSGF